MATLKLTLGVKPEEIDNILVSLYDDARIISVESEIECTDEEAEIIYGDNGETYDNTYTIYRIEAEDGTVRYGYEYDSIVNAFIKLGLDCTVDMAIVSNTVELDEHIDNEYLESLDWYFERNFKA